MSKQKTVKEKIYTKKAIRRDFKANWALYLMVVPFMVLTILFAYLPMGGILMAFENFKPKLGIWKSPWVHLKNFQDFFGSIFAWRVIRNTLIISFLQLLICFPAAIIFALLINELKDNLFKKSVQMVTYMPHFISMVVIAGIIVDFTKSTGVISMIVGWFTGTTENLLSKPAAWRPIYILSDLWQSLGFSSIIYVAALSGIDDSLYEAAELDGANRWQQTLHVTLPGIANTIIIMLILRIGSLMSVGQEKTILLYNDLILEKADIISSFVYRKGLQEFNYGYSTAVSFFNSVINTILIITANALSRKYSETSLF